MRSRMGAFALVLGLTAMLGFTPLAAAGHGNPGHASSGQGSSGHGNSLAAHKCQHGGYRSLVGADGTTFRNTGACVSFAAHGGKFATGIVIPAGKVATLSNAHWNLTPCDALTYGYQLNLGANVALASKPGGPCVSGAVPGATLGPFPTATLLRIFLTDTGDPAASASCNFTFYSDGSHALVTGTNPWIVDIRDSFFCQKPPDVAFPPAAVGLGNLNVTVTVA
jgi:hypothetical protein